LQFSWFFVSHLFVALPIAFLQAQAGHALAQAAVL
jgi:hypothetical protein